MFVYILSIVYKRYWKFLEMCDSIRWKERLCQILLHANIQARKAALVRNYFSRRNNFRLSGSELPSLSVSLSFFSLFG